MSRRRRTWEPPATLEPMIRHWPAIGTTAVLIVISAMAWVASGRSLAFGSGPAPEPEIAGILEQAAQEGTYAYDAVSEHSNMADRNLLGGAHIMSTTERRQNAPPEGLAIMPSGQDCARFARHMAEMRDHLGFCERTQ